jgi:hypothetical protein
LTSKLDARLRLDCAVGRQSTGDDCGELVLIGLHSAVPRDIHHTCHRRNSVARGHNDQLEDYTNIPEDRYTLIPG